MPPPLMLSRRFAPLFWCQFFAAFNDNILKTSLVFILLFARGGRGSDALITLASAIFIAPYFFLSALGGELADRNDKAWMAQKLKVTEIAVAAIAVVGFLLPSVTALFIALFGFGVIAALFGPIKYGILPDHLQREQLPAANALVEGATFIAILLGTIIAGIATGRGDGVEFLLSGLVIVFAVACWLSSLFIPPTGEGAPRLKVSFNVVTSTVTLIRHLWSDSRLWWGAMVTSWFWLVGILVMALIGPLIKRLIGADEATVTVYLALFSVAVGVGSALAAILARGRIELRITFAGAVLLGLCSIDIGSVTLDVARPFGPMPPSPVFASALGIRIALDLAGLAVAGGLFIVPVFAAVQAWAGPDYRARTVAAVNVLNAAFMTGGTVMVSILQKTGVRISILFLAIGVATLAVAMAIWKTIPKNT
jgi:acyl-[acyl-carrier-protein]-phospholipid O-acyltransferase/long-chain-fatty-acid--[acyl-carrier-protein] ligase